MRILILAETGFLTDICLKQSRHSEYLYDQATHGNLSFAIPEFAFAETDGSLHRRLKARQQKLQEIAIFANELQR